MNRGCQNDRVSPLHCWKRWSLHWSRTFTADSDDDAVVWAKQQIEDHSVELWSGPRLVRRLDPAEKRAAEAVTHTIEAGRMVPKNKT